MPMSTPDDARTRPVNPLPLTREHPPHTLDRPQSRTPMTPADRESPERPPPLARRE